MPSHGRKPYIIKWLEREVDNRRQRIPYRRAYNEHYQSLKAAGSYSKSESIRYHSVIHAAAACGINIDEAEAAWTKVRTFHRKKAEQKHKQRLLELFPAFERLYAKRLTRLDKVVHQEEVVNQRIKILRKKCRQLAFKLRKLYDLIQEKKMADQEREELTQERMRATMPTPIVPYQDGESVDLVRDADWVYANLGALMLIDTTKGIVRINPDTLARAPSSGAVTLATYAVRNPDSFVERFINKRMPSVRPAMPATAETESKNDSEKGDKLELDPNLADLNDMLEANKKA